MKKLLTTLLALLYITALFGCGQPSVAVNSNNGNLAAETTTNTSTESTATTTAIPTTVTTTQATTATTIKTTAPPKTEKPTTQKPTEPFEEPTGAAAWVANCNNYINLYKSIGGKVISRIPNGATMKLLGWQYTYAKVNYKGTVGYVYANYIKPKDNSYFTGCLDVVKTTNVYTYNEMVKDIATLEAQYPDVVTVSSIGLSEFGRDIPVICIGSTEAQYHVLLQGAIHAREHLTSWLLMAMAEYWLDNNISEQADVCYHIIPMLNPDGVILSQTQSLNDEQREIYFSDKENEYTSSNENSYASVWKANGLGVDLNRNFSSGWDNINHRNEPSSELYQGTEPFSASETKAIRDYTLKYDFDATISYHATGSIIYYEYGDKEPVNSKSKSLGNAVGAVTGYPLLDSNSVDGAGYKDWAMDELGIPSLTIEIGVLNAPLALREIYSIFARNQQVLPTIANWVKN